MGESIQRSILRMETRVRSERMDNVIYLLATVMLILGFTAQFSSHQKSGLILVAAGFFFITIVNLHGFILRLQGTKIEFDMFVGSLQCFGSLLSFLSILSIIIQAKSIFVWLGIVGSFLMFIGGLLNVLKVYKMQSNELSEATKICEPTSPLKASLMGKV